MTELLDEFEVAEVSAKMEAGEYERLAYGFSHTRRGLVAVSTGRIVFAKQATNANTQADLAHEVATYELLNDQDFAHAPTMLGHNDTTLVLPDMSDWHFAAYGTPEQLRGIIDASDRLTRVDTADAAHLGSYSFQEMQDAWRALQDPDAWRRVRTFAEHADIDSGVLDDIDADEIRDYAQLAADPKLDVKHLIHGDLTIVNTAMNPQTGAVNFIDWDWAQRGNPQVDLTLYLTNMYNSIRRHVGKPIEALEPFKDVINPEFAIAYAGMSLNWSIHQNTHKGAPGELNQYQFEQGVIALKIARGLPI